MSDDVLRIRIIAQRSLKRARDVYEETFGWPINDPSINEKIERLLAEADDEAVEIPAELVLAILLRPGGRKRGHSPSRESKSEKRFNDLAVRVARKLKHDGKTAEQAASAAKKQVRCRISAETILDRIYR